MEQRATYLTVAAEKKAGGVLGRLALLAAVALVIAALIALTADPALAKDNKRDNNSNHDNKDERHFDFNRDGFFFGGRDNFDVNGFDFDDQELESGDIETETDISIEGNNNNQCVGALQFGQTGNFSNQQGTSQFFSDSDDNEFDGGQLSFAPENETACDQEVQQSSAASSWGWSSW